MRSSERTDIASTVDEQRPATIVRIASAIAACGYLAVTLARFIAGESGFAPLLGFGAAISLTSLWLNSRGHALLAGVMLVSVLVCTAVILMVFSEGIHDAALLTVPGILVLAALTVPRRLYIALASVFVLIPAFVGILEITKAIVTPFSDHTDFVAVFDLTIILIMTAAAVELMTATVTGSATRARASEARFRKLFNNSSESIFVFGSLGATGAPGRIIEVNDLACAQLGYTHAEMISLPPAEIFDPESIAKIQGAFSGLRADVSAVCECFYRTKQGMRLPVELSIQRFEIGGAPAIISNARDITERKRADDLIRFALREKEVLLREVHHRVKNNMQVISSLLNLQASQTKDASTRTMLEESRQRVRSIAIIHEKLYNSANLASIDFGVYLKSVADELLRTFGRADVACVLDLEAIPFEIDKAIPAGLIVNELLTNSLRHAFPEGVKGTVRVGLRSVGDGRVELVVRDDGVGFPRGHDVAGATTMGLAIIRTLVEQMQGELAMETAHGTSFTITFSLERKADLPRQA